MTSQFVVSCLILFVVQPPFVVMHGQLNWGCVVLVALLCNVAAAVSAIYKTSTVDMFRGAAAMFYDT